MAEDMPADGAGFPTIVDEAEIRALVRELAAAIAGDHPRGETLIVVATMKGALVLAADLVRQLPMPVEIELLHARSYDGTRRQDDVEVLNDAGELDLSGRHVLLLDCVLDSGRTLAALQQAIAARNPASLKTCVLLRKDRRRAVPIEPDYVGRDIPDTFVVGYGLDCADRWRHLPYVAELPQELAPGAGRPESGRES